jgi:hypothetical protein
MNGEGCEIRDGASAKRSVQLGVAFTFSRDLELISGSFDSDFHMVSLKARSVAWRLLNLLGNTMAAWENAKSRPKSSEPSTSVYVVIKLNVKR